MINVLGTEPLFFLFAGFAGFSGWRKTVTCMQIMLNMKQQEIMSTHIKASENIWNIEIIYFPLKVPKRLRALEMECATTPSRVNFPRHLILRSALFTPPELPATTMKSIYSFSYANILKFLAVTDKKEGK